jgi:hypothetical protein
VRTVFTIFLLSVAGSATFAQSVSIELGPDEIGANQAFTITIVSESDRITKYDPFPEIDGFVKRGLSTGSTTQIINGQISSKYSITQNYYPKNEGVYLLAPFKMVVNGQEVESPGKEIKVGPAVQQRNRWDPFQNDPFDDLFDKEKTSDDFVDIEEDAFLALSTDKSEVYLGEGFTATLAFYVAENNKAPLQFYDLGKQLAEILKELRPTNCWEENFNIENIEGQTVTISGKRYTQYKVYQGSFFPLNNEEIKFPSVGLKMIKYKVARNPSFFGRNRKEDYKTFYSKPKTIKVKELPPHPLKDQVSVGVYRLEERISTKEVQTGNSFNYKFEIYGEGNISSLNKPTLPEQEEIDFYDPSIKQDIVKRNNRVTGSKSFNYYGIPNEPGEYKLGDYFQWVYFNLDEDNYDTLRAYASVKVFGESKKNQEILSSDVGTFYDRIDSENNTLVANSSLQQNKIWINLIILVMIIAVAFFIFRK